MLSSSVLVALLVTGLVLVFALLLARSKRLGEPTDSQAPGEKPQLVKVYRVLDGDTVVVKKGWSHLTIRLDAIDCPEGQQHWGDIAKYGLIKLIGGQHVLLEAHGEDRYGRIVATLYVKPRGTTEWTTVNERMVTLGHAWVYRQYYHHLPRARREQLNDLERWAQRKQVGPWKTVNPVPPWVWRNGAG